MTECERIDRELCIKKYNALKKNIHANIRDIGWDQIKDNEEVLREAIETHKEGNHDVVNGISICESIILNYGNVNKDIYDQLISKIFDKDNEDIARNREYIWPDGYIAAPFLILVLMSHAALSDVQKQFIVDEACTTWHGYRNGPHDIRYWIFKNSNWSITEKKGLIPRLWNSREDFEETCRQWEFAVIDDPANKDKNDNKPNLIRISEGFVDIRKLYNDEDTINRIAQECYFLTMIYDKVLAKENEENKVEKKAIGIWRRKRR